MIVKNFQWSDFGIDKTSVKEKLPGTATGVKYLRMALTLVLLASDFESIIT